MNSTASNQISSIWTTSIDFINTFIIPSICFFGLVTNLVNIKVFLNKELKDIAFRYYLVNGFSNLFYLSICFFFFTFKCGQYCQLGSLLSVQVYLWVFYRYIKGIFALSIIFIQITLSLYRLFIVTNRNCEIFKRYKLICFIFFMVSAFIYTPNFYTQTIITTKVNVTSSSSSFKTIEKYTQTVSSIGKTDFGKWTVIAVTIWRGFISLFIMVIIDICTVYRMRKQLKQTHAFKSKPRSVVREKHSKNTQLTSTLPANEAKKKELKRVIIIEEPKDTLPKPPVQTETSKPFNKSSRNLTKMVISIDIVFLIGNIPNSIVFVFSQYVDTTGYFYLTISAVGNIFLFATAGSDILIYCLYNRLFRKIFRKIFTR